MNNLIWVAFITGLTAGGLSCFAVQGGLITSSIAQQVETSIKARKPVARKVSRQVAPKPALSQRQLGQVLLLFVSSKLVAYTLLGFLLGALGSVFTFSPLVKGIIQVAIGIFLVGNALRMFNIHPIFRYFSFEPPSRVTRYIRHFSRREDPWITPLFLGAMTVLIPCGITQSMMAVAVGTGSPWLGALIMFAFILGTSPTFMGVTWLATNLGSLFQKSFYQVVAVIVLLLGFYTVNSGLVVMGSPLTISGLASSLFAQPAPVEAGSNAQLQVLNSGYSPARLSLPAGQDISLHLITQNTRSCTRALVIPALGFQKILPASGDTLVTIPSQPTGTVLDYSCSMGMYRGQLIFR